MVLISSSVCVAATPRCTHFDIRERERERFDVLWRETEMGEDFYEQTSSVTRFDTSTQQIQLAIALADHFLSVSSWVNYLVGH